MQERKEKVELNKLILLLLIENDLYNLTHNK
jgi:hypothetical protein